MDAEPQISPEGKNTEAVDCSAEAEMTGVKYSKTIKTGRPRVTPLIRPNRFGKHLAHLTTYTYCGGAERRGTNAKVTLIKPNQPVLQGSAAPAAGEEPPFHFNSSHDASAKYKTMTQ